MSKQCDFKAESVRDLVTTSVLKRLFNLKAYAEGEPSGSENNEGGEPTPPQPQINFETLIVQARKEEKEKLYPRIKKLEEENKVLTTSNNTNLLKVAELQTKLDEALKNADESQAVKDLKKQISDLQAENTKLKESTPNEEELRNQIKAEYEVQLFKVEEITKNKDNILPVFEKDIKGTTKEEVTASIQDAIKNTLDTKKALGLVDEQGNPIETTKKPPKKEKPPVANPSGSEEKEYDLEYVRNLDPRSKEYAEWRKKQGLK